MNVITSFITYLENHKTDYSYNFFTISLMLHGGLAVGRWTCDLQVTGSIPGR